MDIASLKPLLSILLWGAVFFFMMRFGCGAHMAGGHGHHGHGRDKHDGEHKDPVCGMSVTAESAKAATVHGGKTYYFCSATCRDNFEKAPDQYAGKESPGAGHAQGGHHG
jgi:YHS domain-containing protein